MGWDGDVLLPGEGWGHFQEMLEFNITFSTGTTTWTTMDPATTATPWLWRVPCSGFPKTPVAGGSRIHLHTLISIKPCQDDLEIRQRNSKAKEHHTTKAIPKI